MSNLIKKEPIFKFACDLASQLRNVKTSTDESHGIATISGDKDGKHLSFTIEQNDLGRTRTASEYTMLTRKSDFKDEVVRLRNKGLKQKEIAMRLGISQSLVSRLLNN